MNTREILESFLSDDNRPELKDLFDINGMTYATNSYAVIRTASIGCPPLVPFKKNYQGLLEKDHWDGEYFEGLFYTNNGRPITVPDLTPYMTEDEYNWVGEDVECPECDGRGQVEWTYKKWGRDFDCQKCGGDGLEQTSRKVYTGNKTFPNYGLYVKLDDVYIDAWWFKKVLTVHNETGSQIELIGTKPNDSAVFRVGPYEIMIQASWIDNLFDKTIIEL